jgi:hypothetical protein
VVFTWRPLLQQHFPFTVEDKNAESTVQHPFAMGLHFFHGANGFILFIYQYHVGYFTHGTKLLNIHGVTMFACTKSWFQAS